MSSGFTEALRKTEEMLATLRNREEARPRDIATLSELETERAQLLLATGGSADDIRSALARSSGAGQAALLILLRARTDAPGQVALEEPGADPRHLPSADLPFGFDAWIRTWFAALIAQDEATLALLGHPETLSLSAPPADLGPDIWPSLCALLAVAGAGGDLRPALASLGGVDRVPDWARKLHVAPVRDIATALARADGPALLKTLDEALSHNHRHWQAEDLPHHPRSVWLPEAVGLSWIAATRGVVSPADLAAIPTFPAALLERSDVPLSCTRVLWPVRAVLSAAEAHWTLERDGATHWTHRTVMREDALVAVYEAQGPTLPAGTAPFELAEDPSTATAPMALDAGDLLTIAEQLAGDRPPTRDADMPAYLSRIDAAIDAVDAVLARIPAAADRVPEESLTSRAARTLLAADPGRLRRIRLEAYRRGLDDARTALEHPPSQSAREGAEAAAAVIEAQLRPVLAALAGPDGAELAGNMVPTDTDFQAAFGNDAAQAAEGYARAWPRPPELDPLDTWLRLDVAVAAAGLLTTSNTLSDRFPGAYRQIAARLQPSITWIAWGYVTDANGGAERYDGLTWIDGRLVWFPKPWRYFAKRR
ncbi:MAG: hypothetical protein AAGA32_16015 [Pseudomonadota bacterium]